MPLEIVQLLLTAGANVNAPFKPASDTARWLEGNINSPNITEMTPLMVATLKGRVDLVEALLQHGAELNARALDGKSALRYASRKRAEPKVGLGIRLGFEVKRPLLLLTCHGDVIEIPEK